jgi:SOS-response transcriptional repressor LexA
MDDKGHMEFSVLTLALPGRPSAPAGVLVFDAENEKLGVKLRRDWDEIAEPEDAEILSGMEGHLKQLSVEMGAERAMEWLESTLSNVLHLGARSSVRSTGLDFTLHQLYREHVPIPVKPFVTHVPRYALRSAAGAFGEQIAEPNEIAEWVEVPSGMRVSKDMFVCEVYGRSMEPLVASGSLCMFRKFGAGSRENKRVLVEDRSESSERYTLKVYHSRKSSQGEEGWVHQSIELEPLNPEFPVLHLEPDQDRYAVVAEFVCVL